jgi:hypothetical protein
MKQLLYTLNMKPVQTGDVVKFSNRSWTIEEVCIDKDGNATEYVWVRSNDEQHQIVRVIGGWIKAGTFETR